MVTFEHTLLQGERIEIRQFEILAVGISMVPAPLVEAPNVSFAREERMRAQTQKPQKPQKSRCQLSR